MAAVANRACTPNQARPTDRLRCAQTARAGLTVIDRLLIGLVLAIGLYAFDDLALSTMLPSVATELAGDELYGASFLAFLLSNLASLVAAGYWIDRVGVVRPFAVAITLFCAGLLLGMLAPSMTVFVVGRALQGLGGGAIQAVVSAVIVIVWQGAARQRAISWATTSWMVPALVGPVIAGGVSQHGNWRYVFAGLMVLTLLTQALVLPRLPRAGRERTGAAEGTPLPLRAVHDALGVALGTGIALFGLNRGGYAGTAVLVLGVAVLWRPLQASLPVGFWVARSTLAAALLLRLFACAVFFGLEAWLPWTLQRTGLASPLVAGLILSASATAWTAATWWVDGALPRVGALRILWIASALMLLGSGLACLALNHYASISLAFLAWAIAGLGMGLCYPVVATLAMGCAEPGREGHLSMMMGLTDTLGITAAIGIGAAVLRADESGALTRMMGIWQGFVLLALSLPLILWWRQAQFQSTPDKH